MSENISVGIELKDKITAEYKRVAKTVNDQNANMSNGFDGLKTNIFSVNNAFKLLGTAALLRLGKSFFKAGAEVETLTVQFKTLLGSTEAATKRMEELQKFATKTPFQLKEVAEASRLLEQFTKGAYSSSEALRVVGDAAAVTSEKDFANVALWVGRAYDALKNNRPIGEALSRLQELGIVVGDVRGKIEDLQKQAKGTEAWAVLENAIKRNTGAMENLSETADGLVSTINDQLGQAMRDVLSGGLWTQSTDALRDIRGALDGLLESGVLKAIGTAIRATVGAATALLKQLQIGFHVAFVQAPQEAYLAYLNLLDSKIIPSIQKALEKIDELPGGDIVKPIRAAINNQQLEVATALSDMDETIDGVREKTKKLAGDLVEISRFALGVQKDVADEVAKNVKSVSPSVSVGIDTPMLDAGAILRQSQALATREVEIRKAALAEKIDLQINFLDDERQKIADENEKKLEMYKSYLARQRELFKRFNEDMRLAGISSAESVAGAIFAINEQRTDKERDLEIARKKESTKNKKAQEAQIYKLNKEAFEKEKKRSLLETFINGIASIAKAWVNPGYPGAIPLSFALGSQNTAQMAMIQAKKMATGGFIDQGPVSGDFVPVRANRGETVLTSQDGAELLSAIRSGSLGRGSQINVTINAPSSDPVAIAEEFEKQYRRMKFRGAA